MIFHASIKNGEIFEIAHSNITTVPEYIISVVALSRLRKGGILKGEMGPRNKCNDFYRVVHFSTISSP